MKSLLALSIVASLSFGDTIYFKNGAVIDGQISKKNDNTVTINSDGNSATYSMNDIKSIETIKVSPPPPAVSSPSISTHNSEVVVPANTVIHVVMTTTLSTKQHRKGHQFKAVLDNDLTVSGTVVAPKGSDVYGEVTDAKQAGRIAGKSSMVIRLTALSIDNKRVTIRTNSINAMNAAGQGKNTAGKLVRGAAIGGLAKGSKGAKNGLKVGAGAAVLTKGTPTGVPTGTLLDFTLTSQLIVNAKQ